MPPSHDTATITFIEKRHEYADVYSYIFKSPHPVAFTAGEYAHVRLTSLPEDTRRVREISFASSPQDEHIQFTIDGSSASDYQKALQALLKGETIEIFKIKGHMTWPPQASQIVMIAGGIGVTPFRSMLRDKAQKNFPLTTTVVHIARDSFLYESELAELADEYTKVRRDELLQQLEHIAHSHRDAHYYVAGSIGFTEAVKAQLNQYGITRIETDAFKGLPENTL